MMKTRSGARLTVSTFKFEAHRSMGLTLALVVQKFRIILFPTDNPMPARNSRQVGLANVSLVRAP